MNQEKPWFEELVANADPELRLAIACWVISKIDDHGNEPGSFRYLIYERLGFGLEAYVPVYEAGGMNITNELDYNRDSFGRTVIEEEQISSVRLKKFFGICDEPGCYKHVCCGFPTENGYRNTCHDHSDFSMKKQVDKSPET
jgi:hypothetical protein